MRDERGGGWADISRLHVTYTHSPHPDHFTHTRRLHPTSKSRIPNGTPHWQYNHIMSPDLPSLSCQWGANDSVDSASCTLAQPLNDTCQPGGPVGEATGWDCGFWGGIDASAEFRVHEDLELGLRRGEGSSDLIGSVLCMSNSVSITPCTETPLSSARNDASTPSANASCRQYSSEQPRSAHAHLSSTLHSHTPR